jgi:uncharacterized protein (DUF1800 family)
MNPTCLPHQNPRWQRTGTSVIAFILASALVACGGGGEPPTSDSGDIRLRDAATPQARALEQDRPAGETVSEAEPPPPQPAMVVEAPASDTGLQKPGAGAPAKALTTQLDAVRLANQATFGPTESLVSQIRQQGAAYWVARQMGLDQFFKGSLAVTPLPRSRYTSGGDQSLHRHTSQTVDFCADKGEHCWRDWSSSTPLLWDFYRNAVEGPDQLRQRVAFALQQMMVVSNFEVDGTYGLRNYHNMLLDHAFGNFRDLLRKVILSPVMGDYLDHVNNDKDAPNENFARELLQLFSLGTCELNLDGTLRGGICLPTYDNEQVRAYAFALTGWTYPAGGATPWGCWPQGSNCRFYQGDMVPVAAFHNSQPRALLSGVSLGAGHSANAALVAVLDSLMNHPNMAPFVSRHLIQQLVTSNPSPAYVRRVATAFQTGQSGQFGTKRKGDLAATVYAVLMDPEARSTAPGPTSGRLREPAQLFSGVLRALNGRTDGDALGWWWGEELRQHVFRSPSVFNFYSPDYPVAGTALVGPAFGIHNANSALNRVNYLNFLLFWDGVGPGDNMPNPLGTQVNLNAFLVDASNPALLVDRLSLLALGESLPVGSRTAVINAVSAFPATTASDRANRVRQAAFLVFASPQYHLTR